MSLLPSTLAVMMVLLLTSAATRLSHDAALSSAQSDRQQLAMMRAAWSLQAAAADLLAQNSASAVSGIGVDSDAELEDQASGYRDTNASADPNASTIKLEHLDTAESAELSDLPLSITRITAQVSLAQTRVRVQADYAIDLCEIDQAAPCLPRLRRIAWRRLSD